MKKPPTRKFGEPAKRLSLLDVFNAPIKPNRPFQLQPRRTGARPMPTKQFAEGVIHYGSRAAYLEPTHAHSKRKERGLPTTRRRPLADPKNPMLTLLDEKGRVVMGDFPIPEPWVRVTPREQSQLPGTNVSRGAIHRAWLREQRAQA